MNPFLHDTVAQALSPVSSPQPAGSVAEPSVPLVQGTGSRHQTAAQGHEKPVSDPETLTADHEKTAYPEGCRPCPAGSGGSVPAWERAGGIWHRGCKPGSSFRHYCTRRLGRALRVAGLLALAWSGSAYALDLNTATLEQLQGIRGIGPKTAQIILEERNRGGRYLSFSDLSDRVRGIGPRRAQALQSAGLTIDGGGTRLSGQGGQGGQGARADAARPSGSKKQP